MSIVFVLIPLAMVMLAVALSFFFWAVRHAQFDDLDTPGVRVLFDDDGGGAGGGSFSASPPATATADSRPPS